MQQDSKANSAYAHNSENYPVAISATRQTHHRFAKGGERCEFRNQIPLECVKEAGGSRMVGGTDELRCTIIV